MKKARKTAASVRAPAPVPPPSPAVAEAMATPTSAGAAPLMRRGLGSLGKQSLARPGPVKLPALVFHASPPRPVARLATKTAAASSKHPPVATCAQSLGGDVVLVELRDELHALLALFEEPGA